MSCDAVSPVEDAGVEQDAGAVEVDAGRSDDAGVSEDAGVSDDAGVDTDAGASVPDAGQSLVDAGDARDWLLAHLADADVRTGTFTTRQYFETPVLVRDADFCCAKYGVDLREQIAPDDRRAALIDVTIHDLVSPDAFGGGIQTANATGITLFLKNVVIEPNWPDWVSYATTNKDGLVLDGSAALYAEDLTIRNWNADGAIDNKAAVSQLVRFKMEGRGNRGIRYWRAGPHYVVDSQLENTGGLGEGSLFWFSTRARRVSCTRCSWRRDDQLASGGGALPCTSVLVSALNDTSTLSTRTAMTRPMPNVG